MYWLHGRPKLLFHLWDLKEEKEKNNSKAMHTHTHTQLEN